MKYKIVVIIPCHNEEENIPLLYDKLLKSINNSDKIKDYNIYFINDYSSDKTKNNILKIIKQNSKIGLINFQKRVGKSIALQTAFSKVKEDVDLVFMMDGDLQDDPKEIDNFINKIESGYDLVSGYKKDRHDNFEKKLASKIYNNIINIIFNTKLHDHNCGFKCFKRKVLNDLKIYDSLHRFITVFTKENNYRVGEIVVEHHKRIHGKSNYGLTRYFIFIKDMLMVKFITMYHKKSIFLFINFIIIIFVLLWLLIINKWSFIILTIIIFGIYTYLLYGLNKYNKFNIKNYNIYYDLINIKDNN